MADVSIIVTAYNIEGYIQECLDSIAAQTLADIEVLVVDDGSSDSTPQRIAEFCDSDPRFIPVLLLQNSPGGVATAANTGLDRATSPWVGFVDGDDFVAPTMFERLVGAARGCDADLAICEYQEVVGGTDERRDPADVHRWAEVSRTCYALDIDTRRFFLRFIAVPWRKLYRRSLLELNSIRFPVSDGFYEDNPFHWFSVISARSIAVVPEVLCYHRVGRIGQTMDAADERLFRIFSHHDTIRTWLDQRTLLDVYETTLLNWLISQMEWIARRTPPELRRTLFDILVPNFSEYSSATIASAVREGNKGVTALRLSTAVSNRDYAAFVRALASRPDTRNPFVSAAYHFRHSGVRHTALLTRRYLRNRAQASPASRMVARVTRAGREPGGQDVMFALMVIESRLGAMERRLGDLGDQLAAVERWMAEPSVRTEVSGVDEQGRDGAPAPDSLEDPVSRG